MALPDDFRAQSRKRWDAQATGWEARREALRSATMPVSAWMIDALDPQPGQALLELAGGTADTGLLAAELLAPTGEVILSDFSPEMLAAARRRAEELGVANVRFKQIDAETSIDVPAGSLDGVLCRWGYMLMADPGNALRETRRVLRPGGRLALAAWTGPDENPWSSEPNRAVVAAGLAERSDPDAPGQFAWAQEGRLAAQLDAAGFTEHHVERLAFSITYASVEEWWASQLDLSGGFGGAVRGASAAELAPVRDHLEEVAARVAGPDGAVALPAATWVAWADA